MANISRDDVLHLMQLSNLQLTDAEVDELRPDLEKIVGLVDELKKLDTTGVEPTYQLTGLENVWRDDKISQPLEPAALLGLAPESKDQQIKVPKVL